jgi:hypothetical protein
MHERQTVTQRRSDMIHELEGRGSGAAFVAINDDEIRGVSRLQNGLYNRHKFPMVANTQFDPNWLSAREVAQARNKAHQLYWRRESRMHGRRNAVATNINATNLRNLGCDLRCGQNPAEARFGTLTELDLNHLDLRIGRDRSKLFGREFAFGGAAAEVARAYFPDQISAGFPVIRADATFARIVRKIPKLSAEVQRPDRVGG